MKSKFPFPPPDEPDTEAVESSGKTEKTSRMIQDDLLMLANNFETCHDCK